MVFTFWPNAIVRVTDLNGERYLGQYSREESYELGYSILNQYSGENQLKAKSLIDEAFVKEIDGLKDDR